MSDQLVQKVHLLVLIHGMWGNPSHLASMHRIMEQTHVEQSSDGTKLHVMLAETNQAESTYDGIDWGGERVASEIFQEVEKLEQEGRKVTRFSVTGYSLGGLLARYVVGVLHQRQFFTTITPVNFNTLATPHIGLPEYPSLRSRLSSIFVPRFFSRTGEQFYSVDTWSNTGKSLLEVMADPAHAFYQGLRLFPHIRIYANAINDGTVPYLTAYVELEDPFINHHTDDLAIEYDDKYYPIIKSFTVRDTPVPKSPKRHGPRPYTLAWFRSYKLPLPPRLQAPFPFNIATAVLLPIIVPVILTLVFIRVSISSYYSRLRIRLLESEDTSATQRLIHIVGQLERQVEDIAVDLVDDSTLSPHSEQISKVVPRITPAQRRMVAALNALPQLKKELAFIPNVMSSHATIIARDIKNFEFHKIGEGVLRHWADAFIL